MPDRPEEWPDPGHILREFAVWECQGCAAELITTWVEFENPDGLDVGAEMVAGCVKCWMRHGGGQGHELPVWWTLIQRAWELPVAEDEGSQGPAEPGEAHP